MTIMMALVFCLRPLARFERFPLTLMGQTFLLVTWVQSLSKNSQEISLQWHY